MGAETEPFFALDDDLTWFVRATEVRLLGIVTSADDRERVVAQVRLAEGNAYNRSPFFVLEDAHTAASDGWSSRAARVRALYEQRRAAMSAPGIALPALAPPAAAPAGDLVAFGRAAAEILAAHAATPPLVGAIIVLAPTRVERASTFEASLRALLNVPELSALRFIVIDVDASSVAELTRALGEEIAMATTCVVDRQRSRKEHEKRVAAAAKAPPGAALEVQAGFAGPRVAPPPRVGRPTPAPLPPDVAAALGPAAALAGAAGADVRRLVYAAAHALQSGNGADAVRHQRAAAERCFAEGLAREGCLMEVCLGAYLVHLGERAEARRVYERAATRAEPLDRSLAARALLGLGAVLLLAKESTAGVVAYRRAGELAQEGGETLVALEAFRLAGQVALDGGATQGAAMMWQRALALAEALPVEAIGASSAVATARALAAVCEREGLHAAAASLREQADRYERQTDEPGPSE